MAILLLYGLHYPGFVNEFGPINFFLGFHVLGFWFGLRCYLVMVGVVGLSRLLAFEPKKPGRLFPPRCNIGAPVGPHQSRRAYCKRLAVYTAAVC